MKTIIEKSGWQDIVIEQDSIVVLDKNEPKYINEQQGIAEFKRFVKNIYLYQHEYKGSVKTDKAIQVVLNKEQILMLADKIRQIEKETFEDIYVKSDDLPW